MSNAGKSWERRIYELLDSPSPDNLVYVTQSNFAETLGNTPNSNTLYVLTDVIDTGGTSVVVPSGGLNISGYTFDLSGLTCSVDNYTMFSSTGAGNVLFDNFYMEVLGTNSQVYDLVSNSGFEAIEVNTCNYNNCTSLGVLDNFRQGLETGTGRFGGTPQLTFKGTWLGGFFIDTYIVRGLGSGSYSLFSAGAGFTMNSRFRSNMNLDLPSGASYLDFTPSNFDNPSTVQLVNGIVTRNGASNPTDANLTPNISESDVECSWSGNTGIPNTFEGGEQRITTEATTTVSSSGTQYDIAGTWSSSELQHFESVGVGGLKHVGTDPREYRLFASLSLDCQANAVVGVHVVKYDDSSTSESVVSSRYRQVNSFVGGRDVAFFEFSLPIELDKGDYTYLKVSNETSTTNITVEDGSSLRVEER